MVGVGNVGVTSTDPSSPKPANDDQLRTVCGPNAGTAAQHVSCRRRLEAAWRQGAEIAGQGEASSLPSAAVTGSIPVSRTKRYRTSEHVFGGRCGDSLAIFWLSCRRVTVRDCTNGAAPSGSRRRGQTGVQLLVAVIAARPVPQSAGDPTAVAVVVPTEEGPTLTSRRRQASGVPAWGVLCA